MSENHCRWCGETLTGTHPLPPIICPKVKAIEFADDGVTVRRVEFMVPRDLMPMNGWPMSVPAPAPYPPPQIYPPPQWRYPTSICGVGQAADPQIALHNSAGRPTQ